MNRNCLRYGLVVAALAGLAGTASAKTIVVRATGPSSAAYPAGKVLPDKGSVTLQANDVLVILDGNGTRTLRGAGTHALAASTRTASAAQSSFRRLLADSGTARPSRGGVSRGSAGLDNSGVPARSPNLWYVDIRKGGTICVADPDNLKLWRPQVEGDTTALIARPADGKTGTVTFFNGSMVKAWPTRQMPVADGAAYTIKVGEQEQVAITFALLPVQKDAAPAIEDMAVALAQRGCTTQLDLLADAVSTESSAS